MTENVITVQHALPSVPSVRLKSYGDRAFSVAAPKHWNDIPLVDVFKSRLKTYLFRLAFNWLFVLVLLLVSYFLFLIVKRYRAFVYTAIQIKLLLLLLKRMANCWPWPISTLPTRMIQISLTPFLIGSLVSSAMMCSGNRRWFQSSTRCWKR